MNRILFCFMILLAYWSKCSGQVNLDTILANKEPQAPIYFADDMEVQPHFPGGIKKFYQFIAKHIKYPDGVQGKVVVDFIIDKKGKVSNVKITKSLSPNADAEALRVVRLSPKWIRGTVDGRPKAFEFTVPINFALH